MKSNSLNDGGDASPQLKVLPITRKHCATMVPLPQHVAMMRDPQRQPDHVPEAEYEAAMNSASADHRGRAARFRDAALPHLDAVYTLARYLLREPADAEDAVQECYLRALRHFDTLRNSDVKPWLFAILRNVCRVEYARRSRVVLYDVNAELDKSEEAEPLWSEAPETPETTMIRKLDAATIQRLVAALPDPFREVIVLREINDLSYRDIAEVVGAPVGTVMSRLARARSILRTAWLAEGQLT